MDLRVGQVSVDAPRLTVITPARSDIVLANVQMVVQYIGTGINIGTYGPIDTQGNTTLLFQLDTQVFNQPYGFFLGVLMFNGLPYAQLTFQYGTSVTIPAPLQISTTGPYIQPVGYACPNWSGTGIDGPGTFIGLKDTPDQYAGYSGYRVTVNATETGLLFSPVAVGEGTVTDIYTGSGLTGGPITNVGTLALDSPTLAAVALAETAVQSVVAGTNVTVNNADPKNPIVSAALTGGVLSFNARVGTVVPATGDYTFAQIAAKPTTLSGYGITDAATFAQGAEADTAVQGVVAGTNITVNNTDPKHPVVSASSASGTVTSVSVTTANGVSGTVATSTTTPAITLTLGAITPASMAAAGAVSGSNLSGTNTGDQTITLTGDLTGSGTGSFATTLATSGVTAATYGDATHVSQVTVDAKGRVTAASSVAISAASGTVTSVGLTAPAIFAVGGTPVTTAGTLAVTLATQTANLVWAGPTTGSAAAPTFRSLVAADVPTLNQSTTGSAATLTTARTIGLSGASATAASFDGSANVVITVTAVPTTLLTGALASAQFPALTGDVTTTAGSLATTLATSGVTAATYGDATHVGQFTVDAKGRVTSAGSVAISAGGSGTVTSVAVSGGTTGLTTSGGPITTSGTVTIAGTLAIANGGTGATAAGAALTALGGVSLANTSAWTSNQFVTPVSSTSSGTVTPAAGSSNNFQYTMSGNLTIANPTGLSTGMVLNFCVDENGTGGYTITLGSLFKWAGATVPTWVTTASAKNFFSAYYDGTILRCSGGAGYG